MGNSCKLATGSGVAMTDHSLLDGTETETQGADPRRPGSQKPALHETSNGRLTLQHS